MVANRQGGRHQGGIKPVAHFRPRLYRASVGSAECRDDSIFGPRLERVVRADMRLGDSPHSHQMLLNPVRVARTRLGEGTHVGTKAVVRAPANGYASPGLRG